MAYFDCIVGGSGGKLTLTVTCDSDFAGETISCSDGTTTLTATCPSSSPYTVEFKIPNGGTWTISSGIDSMTVVITDTATLHKVPVGSTATPVNDIQTWLQCAGIWDKNYTTLDEVLADASTLQALIASHNAVDYMVRSTAWCSVSGLVPTMTSDTTPSGVVSTSLATQSGYQGYKAFDGNNDTSCASSAVGAFRISYKFTSEKVVAKAYINQKSSYSTYAGQTANVQYSDDGVSWTTVASGTTNISSDGYYIETYHTGAHLYWGIEFSSLSGYSWYANTIQFYDSSSSIVDNHNAMTYIGANDYCADTLLADDTWCDAICNSTYFESVLNVKVPTMTSDTAPSGQVVYSSQYTSQEWWRAFGSSSTSVSSTATPEAGYVGYMFTSSVKIRKFKYIGYFASGHSVVTFTFNIQGSNTGNSNDWHNVKSNVSLTLSSDNQTKNVSFVNDTSYKYYRMKFNTASSDSGYSQARKLQFWGRA